MPHPTRPRRVSVHGCHSREYCLHAADPLEAMIQTYIAQGFEWVGITEHMPPPENTFLYPEERQAGLDAATLLKRFERYISHCRHLQSQFKDRIQLYVAMETETYRGAFAWIGRLSRRLGLDYLVGSVHHVDDIPIDYSPTEFQRAVDHAGGIEALYCRYFDQQKEMIVTLAPAVVAHFDLIRLFDKEYLERLAHPEIHARITRNLELIRDLDLILECNLRAFHKGAAEPYPALTILRQARDLDIRVVPGDDSHSTATVGNYFDTGVALLTDLGFDLQWPSPVR
jgi:histidinol-phosphatase (PHP family)